MSPVSLDVDREGRVWVGTSRDFGFVHTGATGPEFVSVAGDSLAKSDVLHSFVQTRSTSRGVFFLSIEVLALWDGERVSVWNATADGGFMDVEEVAGDLFVLCGRRGLLHLEDGELVESDRLGTNRVLFDALAGTGDQLTGVWLSGRGLQWIRSDDLEPRSLSTRELRRGPNYVSDALSTGEGSLVVSTSRGIVVVDDAGEFQAWLDRDHGLPSSLAYSLMHDKEGGVWAGLAHGVVRFDPASAATFFGKELGLQGTPLTLTRHDGVLYCGTDEGLFRLAEGTARSSFDRVRNTPEQPFFGLLSTSHGLLGSTQLGLISVEEDRVQTLTAEEPIAFAAVPEELIADVETVVLAGFNSIRLMRWID